MHSSVSVEVMISEVGKQGEPTALLFKIMVIVGASV